MTKKFSVSDTDLSARFPIYTRANVGEVFPDPVTPLTCETLWLSELGWRDAWVRIGAFDIDEFPSDQYCQLGVTGGYCYLNASLARLFGERAPGLSWQAIDDTFFGTQPGIPPYTEAEGDVRPDLTEKIGATFAWVFGQRSVEDLQELTDDRRSTKALVAARPNFADMTDRELWERYQSLLPMHRALFAHHVFATYMATVPLGVISAVATAVGRPDLVLTIVSGFGDVDSAAPSTALWDMGRTVRNSPLLTAEFDRGVPGLLDRLRADPGAKEFLAEFAAFVGEYGSRGPNEWEGRSPTWETRPELALSAIERMRLAPDEMSPERQNAQRADDREAAAAELMAMVAGDEATAGQLGAAIASSKAWIPARERTKTNNIRFIHELRMNMREIGRRMVSCGAFDEIEDFGMVRISEFDKFLVEPHSMTDVIRERRSEYHRLQELTPSFLFVGSDGGPSTWERRDAVSPDTMSVGESLAGMPGCPGVAEGRARVILDSNDPGALDVDDILVAPITDPSWTPLFVPAAAVVVDVGAPLSHAIIVSRELGIPCVVSATNATRRIPDGARIRVDGSTGVVTVLEMPS